MFTGTASVLVARPRDEVFAFVADARNRPRTNGKAERFIRTMLGGWAYGAIYGSSEERTAALSGWLDHYNYRLPHGSLGHKAPMDRLRALQEGNNLVGSYT